ncbi:hypothetical protein A2U01_0089912, partial [Trifolium medium]|nr:hypothetical protein [Trifolium medium]
MNLRDAPTSESSWTITPTDWRAAPSSPARRVNGREIFNPPQHWRATRHYSLRGAQMAE